MQSDRTAYQRWREANAQARARENELSLAWSDYFDRRTPRPPSDELIADVQRLRSAADALLQGVIETGTR